MTAAESLSIRCAARQDLESIRRIYNHHIRTGVATFDLEEKSAEDRSLWFEQFSADGPHQILVAIEEGQVQGFACSSSLKPKAAYSTSVEVSIYLAAGCEGRGIGRRLYEQLFARLATTALHRAYAGITRPNPASEALHRSFGFVEAGLFREVGRKFGRFHDVAWLEKNMDLKHQEEHD